LHAFDSFVVLIGFERMPCVVVLRTGIRGNQCQKGSRQPAKVTPFDGVVESASAAFDQKTSRCP
jgi:hypothetical protein